jgi:hypothetical protein
LRDNNFDSHRLIYTGLALGTLLVLAGLTSERRNFKKHFEFTYTNFGTHLLFISGLAGLFVFDNIYPLWFLLLLGMAWYLYLLAMKKRSFYFLLIITLYTYIALSYMVIRLLMLMREADMAPVYLGLLYFIFSAIGLIRVSIKLNKKIKANDSL